METGSRKTCALYLRVSTQTQSNDPQRLQASQLAHARGYEIVEVYEEKISGKSLDRPEWKRLKLDAHKGRFQVCVVAALDRIGRGSMIDTANEVLAIEQLNVSVESVREPWLSQQGAAKSLILAVLAWISAEEVRARSCRVKAALQKAKADGKRLGRRPVCVDRRLAYRLVHVEGLSYRQAAKKLGIGASTLHRVLADEERMQAALGGVPLSEAGSGESDPQDG